MMKLLISIVTYYTPQNRVSDTITHVILNTINGVVPSIFHFTIKFHVYIKFHLGSCTHLVPNPHERLKPPPLPQHRCKRVTV